MSNQRLKKPKREEIYTVTGLGDKYRNIHIRLLEAGDAEFARQLHNSSDVLFNLTDARHVSKASQDDWVQAIQLSKTSQRYLVSARIRPDSAIKPIGVVRVDQLDFVNSSAQLGLDISKFARGRGYATQVYEYMLWYLFDQLGLNRIGLYVIETNSVAINLYKKLGFIEEGVLREAIFRDGKFNDYIQMSMLRSEYNELTRES